MIKKTTILFIFFIQVLMAFATHNRAGEITYRQISDYTFEFTITTFTNTKPMSDGTLPADRPSLPINWGDGKSDILPRVGITKLSDSYQKNVYAGLHTYAGPATFEIFVEDPNRNEGVQNIPNSVLTVFSIKTILQINPTLGFNNTPILMNPPLDQAAIGQIFIHNPAAFDPDGDSLSYELTICTGENGDPIPNYTFPPSSNRPIFIEPATGNLIWDSPTEPGSYNVAFYIFEWRKGIKIGRITRDMQIEVYESDNRPPTIDSIPPMCVLAGDTVQFTVVAHDSTDETISLSATGGTFTTDVPSVFTSAPAKGTVTGLFTWYPQCTDIREQPYQIIFKATDNNDEVSLVDQLNVEITVMGPPPQLLKLEPTNNSIHLKWKPYYCQNQKGFLIYRSISPFGFVPDKCETGVPLYTGFQNIAEITNPEDSTYIDNNNEMGLPQGYNYCYMMTANFDNDLESMASNEMCAELVRGTPIITNVSVTRHDAVTGEIFVGWSRPLDLDTLKYPGPHQYIIKRAEGIWGNTYHTIDTLEGLDDTLYFDQNLNTIDFAYNYKVEIHNPGGLTELPMIASSIFPKIDGSNKKLTLGFLKNTPWTNYKYTVFRENEISGQFDSIGTTTSEIYVDPGLVNGQEYCYRVTSYGQYDLPGIKKPIVNLSHTNCGAPIDTIPPLAPELKVSSDCEYFYNTLTWTIRDDIGEILKYNIYLATGPNASYTLTDSVMNHDTLIYRHYAGKFPSGCYRVTSVDSNYNESPFSNYVCVDICDFYELPNIFTPNADGINDLMVPMTPADVIDHGIDHIDLKMYSRWGDLIFETTNPHIEWDATSSQTKVKVSPGVFYYVCEVYEKRISGVEHRTLTGFVHVIYGENIPQTE